MNSFSNLVFLKVDHHLLLTDLHKKHHIIKCKHVYNHESDSHTVWKLKEVILTASVQCQQWNLTVHWSWRKWIRYAQSSEMLRAYRFWSKCMFVCSAVSSSTKNLWEHLLLLWLKYEILLMSTKSTSSCMSFYHSHNFWSQVNLSKF